MRAALYGKGALMRKSYEYLERSGVENLGVLEDRVEDSVKEELQAMGHELEIGEVWFTFPCVQACERKADGTLKGAADPRRDGKALGY